MPNPAWPQGVFHSTPNARQYPRTDMRRLVLASASPRRRELLAQAGFSFEVHPAHIPEDPLPDEDPIAYVVRLAREKAEAVFAQLSATQLSSDGAATLQVLGADTTVTLDNLILGKPEDAADAARMLRMLSGRTHRVITGVAVVTQVHRSCRGSYGRPVLNLVRRGNRCIHRHRRTHGQSRRLRDSRPRRPLDSARPRLLLQRRRPADRARLHASRISEPCRRQSLTANRTKGRELSPGLRSLQLFFVLGLNR